MSIPFVDLLAQHAEVADEVRAGLDEVFAATAFVGGPAVSAFEADYAAYVGAAHCIGVANGTDALELALRAVGVRPGGEVIIPANTFIATAEAASRIGAVPVPVDVDPVHLLMDPAAVRAAVGPRTEAIVPVHLFGQVAPVEELGKIAADAGVPLIEDAAQAQGARRNGRSAGTFGLAAGTSFYPGKNLGAAGDGGAVTTSDAQVARSVRVIAAHGSAHKYDHEVIGFNSRLDTVQAVVLAAKLRRLEAWNAGRRAAADRYAVLLDGVDAVQLPTTAEGNEDIWHLYVVQVEERDRVLAELSAAGIGVGIHYPTPVHLTAAYADLGHGRGAFPVAEAAADRILSLPMFPHLTSGQQEQVVEQLARSVARTAP
ncbi:MAG: erythromycin biosynthesis sensory transduction protein eryC1 [Cellulomonas sp. 73-145]|uniref:DegT/DnrJ/EryC1/StrS family aminotransferase n=1 Tax=Cellulomonas sp. 73-145 TaxID=1895739 RepID=UPI00092CD165|nr:DegT/DnrJ/EryC1/StrS family aminotransferase [Cellulomonas sp. 73-145]OJV56944.1 MAG: erythromycin biosynthesis sensory transduction protein eryC1 [Cellulomonas sp. 73-145]